jgi:hypothetical protein
LTGVATSEAVKKAIDAEAEALRRLTDEQARATVVNDMMFERQQLGRGEIDAGVASTLRGAGLQHDPLQEGYDHVLAGQLRLNEYLTEGRDIAQDFFGGMARDMMDAETRADAVGNAFDRLSDKLLDMASEQLVAKAFGAIAGAFLGGGGAGGLSEYAQGVSSMGAGLYHSGTDFVGQGWAPKRDTDPRLFMNAPRFHSGLQPLEFPAILQWGETVTPRGGRQPIHVDARTSLDGRGADPAAVKRIEVALAQHRRDMPRIIQNTMLEAKKGRHGRALIG